MLKLSFDSKLSYLKNILKKNKKSGFLGGQKNVLKKLLPKNKKTS